MPCTVYKRVDYPLCRHYYLGQWTVFCDKGNWRTGQPCPDKLTKLDTEYTITDVKCEDCRLKEEKKAGEST